MTTTSDVALIGCNSIVREGLCRLLSESKRHIVHAGSSIEGLRSASIAVSDFLLILVEDDRSQWRRQDLDTVHQLFPEAKIIVLAREFDFSAMLEALRAGAYGYLTNDLSWERLVGYLDLIALGEKIFPSQLAQKLIDDSAAFEPAAHSATLDAAHLSARELDILSRLVAGLPNKLISRELEISEATVKVHVKAVLRKLRVSNRTQAAIWASAQGLHGLDEAETHAGRSPAAPERALPNAIRADKGARDRSIWL